ncbi:hypothetical protein OUZ56_032622 [Daphnia magna]|uniref:Uncharacterized protein n=1 Tax=Daphnia magna TaxID=35525 RepID=A0ABR0B9G2_9CRUS|nr:hypothetical protein OUZ56_032622 [Daphnia magna]
MRMHAAFVRDEETSSDKVCGNGVERFPDLEVEELFRGVGKRHSDHLEVVVEIDHSQGLAGRHVLGRNAAHVRLIGGVRHRRDGGNRGHGSDVSRLDCDAKTAVYVDGVRKLEDAADRELRHLRGRIQRDFPEGELHVVAVDLNQEVRRECEGRSRGRRRLNEDVLRPRGVPLRAGRSSGPLNALDALNPLDPLNALGARVAGKTLDPLRSWVALGARRPRRSREARPPLQTSVALRALWTDCARGPGRAGEALDTLVALRSGGTNGPLRARRARGAGKTDRTLRADVTLWALRTRRAGGPLDTLRSGVALGTRGPHRTVGAGCSGGACAALRALRAGIPLRPLRAALSLDAWRPREPLRTGDAADDLDGLLRERRRAERRGRARDDFKDRHG